MIHALLAFLAGVAYECGCVFWVHHVEGDRPIAAALWACFIALVTVLGVESFLSCPLAAGAYVVGYGAGTHLGVLIRRRLRHQALK